MYTPTRITEILTLGAAMWQYLQNQITVSRVYEQGRLFIKNVAALYTFLIILGQ